MNYVHFHPLNKTEIQQLITHEKREQSFRTMPDQLKTISAGIDALARRMDACETQSNRTLGCVTMLQQNTENGIKKLEQQLQKGVQNDAIARLEKKLKESEQRDASLRAMIAELTKTVLDIRNNQTDIQQLPAPVIVAPPAAPSEPTAPAPNFNSHKAYHAGDVFHFGAYDWTVLEITSHGNVYALCNSAVACLAMDENKTTTKYHDRVSEFLKKDFRLAFTADERLYICMGNITLDNNEKMKYFAGLLYSSEYEKFRHLIPAISQPWWTWTYYQNHEAADVVMPDGSIQKQSISTPCAVRPAIYLSLAQDSTATPPSTAPAFVRGKTYQVGDVIRFGNYDWTILYIDKDGDAKIICNTAQPAMPFSDTSPCNWQNSIIRSWLNDQFYETFSEEERKRIYGVRISENGEEFTSKFAISPAKPEGSSWQCNEATWLRTFNSDNTKVGVLQPDGKVVWESPTASCAFHPLTWISPEQA